MGKQKERKEKVMKTQRLIAVVAVMMLALVGCPEAPIVPGNGDGNDQVLTGSLLVKGDLYGRDGSKVLSQDDMIQIGEAFIEKATSIEIYLNDPKDYSNYRRFSIPVVDGRFEGTCNGIVPGTYDVRVSVVDKNYYILFTTYESNTVVIEAGETSSLLLQLEFLSRYTFRVMMNGLPGSYDKDGNAMILNQNGNHHYAWWWRDSIEEPLVFNCSLPLDFEGGALQVLDQNGDEQWADLPLVPIDLDWETYNFGDVLVFDYVPPTWLGGLDIDIVFPWEGPNPPIPVPIP
ncbi:MAG: hypothetical protein A3D39_02770 [Candidatus Buchananbacteria bacterium RIFCSPHIGHO2_02_FULL_39_17]|nr:MAG: hypothetical protein A3D39_02770 [Candidatus Buchananbacteria bacterium RIFCSPHIGHO2_02_FULL_39_17]